MRFLPRGMKRKWLVAGLTLVLFSIWYFKFDWFVDDSNHDASVQTRFRKLKPVELHKNHGNGNNGFLSNTHRNIPDKTYVELSQILRHVNKEKSSEQLLFENKTESLNQRWKAAKNLGNSMQVKIMLNENKLKVLDKNRNDTQEEKTHVSKKFTFIEAVSHNKTMKKHRTKPKYFQKSINTDPPLRKKSGKMPSPHETRHESSHQLLCKGSFLEKVPEDKQEFLLVQNIPVYVFSAYLDTRNQTGGPHIRIIAAGLQLAYNDIPPMYCTTWWRHKNGRLYGVNSGPVRYIVIYKSTLWPKMYTSHFILCDISLTQSQPVAVSIVPKPCTKYSHALPIQTLIIPQQDIPHMFSLCISPLYGRVSHTQLIEFIEIHRLLGVEKFTFYRHSISSKLESLFKYYQQRDLVTIVNWNFPKHVEQSYFMQRVSLNDCLYRNMAKSKFVGIYDLDEIVVPNKVDSWNLLFSSLQKDNPDGGAFLFQHAYFRRNYSIKADPYLMTQTSRWRTSRVYPEGKIRCKSIHYAQRSLAVDIHFPYELLPGYNEVLVKPDTAKLHHYRESPMSNFNTQSNLKFIEDNIMLKYGQELERRTSKVIKSIG